MPQVAIFAAYSAGAMVPLWADVPDATTANRIKALAGHEKTASLFARLAPHSYDKKCPCHACDREKDGDWIKPGWAREAPRRLYVRFDIGARNVRLNVKGGELFVVVAECDVSEWLMTLPLAIDARRGLLLALPLSMERATKSRKEVEAA